MAIPLILSIIMELTIYQSMNTAIRESNNWQCSLCQRPLHLHQNTTRDDSNYTESSSDPNGSMVHLSPDHQNDESDVTHKEKTERKKKDTQNKPKYEHLKK